MVLVGFPEWQPDDPRFVAPEWKGCLFLEDGLVWASKEVVDEKFFTWWVQNSEEAVTPEKLKSNFGLFMDDADFLKGHVWSWFRNRAPGAEKLMTWTAVLNDDIMLEASLDAAKNIPDGMKQYAHQKTAPLHGRLAVLRSEDATVRYRGAEQSALLPDWVFEELLEDEDLDVRVAVQLNELAPAKYRFASLAAEDRYFGADFFHWGTKEELLWVMASMEGYVKKYAAHLAEVALLPDEGWRLLSTHHDDSVRADIAMNWNCPPQFLYMLMRDPSPKVRGCLTENGNLPTEFREHLTHDSDPTVRMSAKKTMMRRGEQSLEFFMRRAQDEAERVALFTQNLFQESSKEVMVVQAERAVVAVQDPNPAMRAAGVHRMHQSHMHAIYNADCPLPLIPALLSLAASSEDVVYARRQAVDMLVQLEGFPKHRLLEPFGEEPQELVQLRKELVQQHWLELREYVFLQNEQYRGLPDDWVLRLVL